MPRLVAFLRAVNVGGHAVPMARLRDVLAGLDPPVLTGVETFLASGNVVFETRARGTATLERRIEEALRRAFGFPVATFLRTGADVAKAAASLALPPAVVEAATALNVGFAKEPIGAGGSRALEALRTEADELRARGREVYWASRRRQTESTISGAVIEKALGQPVTLRGISTLRKLVARFGLDAH